MVCGFWVGFLIWIVCLLFVGDVCVLYVAGYGALMFLRFSCCFYACA